MLQKRKFIRMLNSLNPELFSALDVDVILLSMTKHRYCEYFRHSEYSRGEACDIYVVARAAAF